MRRLIGTFYFIVALCTAIIGHQIHGSIFWSLIDFWLWPLAWLKWGICQQVNLTTIKTAFAFFMK